MTLRAADLRFERPARLQADRPPEARGADRSEVRLLVSSERGHAHHAFAELPRLLRRGDLLVVNDSATLPAALPAEGPGGPFRLNLCTRFGPRLWLAEPRRSAAEPGPVPGLGAAVTVTVGGTPVRLVCPHPGLPRLWFAAAARPLDPVMEAVGDPIRYAYVPQVLPLEAYQTVFARRPGSAEMPSAGRPFTEPLLRRLRQRGVGIATLTLHTGVSSLELQADALERATLFAEAFEVPPATARRVNHTRAAGGRVIAVGTTVVRALESVWDGQAVRPARGFTRRFVRPGNGGASVDGLLTGLHDPGASHLAMLFAVAGRSLVHDAYAEAVAHGYLWHEFGDSHLLLPRTVRA